MLVLFVLFAACSKNQEFSPGYTTEALTSDVVEFEDTFDVDVHFEVAFVETLTQPQAGAVSKCYKSGLFRRVEILESIDPMRLKLAVFHELGHCQLNLAHFDTVKDIMNSNVRPGVAGNGMHIYIPKMLANFEEGNYQNE